MNQTSNPPSAGNVVDFPANAYIHLTQQSSLPANPLGPSGPQGPGDGGVMEARVARLESDMEHVKKGVERLNGNVDGLTRALGDVRERLTKVETKIDHLPSKGFTVTVTILALTAISLIVGIAANLGRIL